MKKTWFKIFMGLFVLLFAGLWIAGSVAEARSKKREHHRHHYPYSVEVVGDIVAVAGGGFHTIELKTDGTVWAWGRNEFGQLGDGTKIDSPAPIQVSGLTDITAITAGVFHTIALKTDGTVWAWGSNEKGQLGDGTTTNSAMPVQINSLTDVAAVAAGSHHTLALKNDGTVWAWGWNLFGQLGDGTRAAQGNPTPVQVSGLTDVTAIAAGYGHTIAVKADGTVWRWGSNWLTPVQVIGLTDITAIAAGAYHDLVLKTDGTLWAWGYNGGGQLGDGTTTTSRTTPVQVIGLTNVTAIATGWLHNIAVKADGTAWAWGSNERGQLGVTTTETCEIYVSILEAPGYTYPTFCSTAPVQVSGLTDIATIAAGSFHSIAIKSNGTEWAWGYNEDSQLGATTTETCGYEDEFNCSPTPIPVRDKVTGTFSVGGTVSSLTGTLVLQNNGGDDLTITENGPFTFATELEDLDIYDITVLSQPFDQTCGVISGRINAADVIDIEIKCFTFADIAAGGRHSIALETDGTVWAWGYGGLGQLGNGTIISSNTPVQVSDLTDITAVAAGFQHTLAIKADGTVWAWGINASGELGATTTERCQGHSLYNCSTTPVEVSDLTDVIAIAAGKWTRGYSIALKSDGTVWAWGSNWSGQLGDGTTIDSTVPVQVNGLTDVIAIAGGGSHTIALKIDGTVWAWGSNWSGQLGDGTTIDSTTPVQVSDLTDITAIAAGGSHNIVLKADGTVWAWGYNHFGQLGDGTTIDSTVPVQVNGLMDVIAIAGGEDHTIALKTDGTVWVWGDNYYGQLGIITTETCGFYLCTTPVQINGLTDVTAISTGEIRTLVLKTDGTVWTTTREATSALILVTP